MTSHYNNIAALSEAIGPSVLAVMVTFFAMGVGILGAVLKLYRKLFRRQDHPLSLRFLVQTVLVLAITAGSWGAVAQFPEIIPLWFVGFALFMVILTWVWLTVLCLKLIAYARRKAILGAGQVAAMVVPKRDESAVPTARPEALRLGTSGPVETVPTISQRLSAGVANGKVLQWAPFMAGLVVMAVSALLFKLNDPASGVEHSPAGFPDLGGMMTYVRINVFAVLAVGAALLLLIARFAARRNIPYAGDPWARLERLAAAERARK